MNSSKFDNRKAIALSNQGLSQRKIAEEMGVHYLTVHRNLKKIRENTEYTLYRKEEKRESEDKDSLDMVIDEADNLVRLYMRGIVKKIVVLKNGEKDIYIEGLDKEEKRFLLEILSKRLDGGQRLEALILGRSSKFL